MSDRSKRLSRRNFLMTVGAGGAAAAAAAIATKNSAPSSASPDNSKRATRGYQTSEHVNNYYRTAKV